VFNFNQLKGIHLEITNRCQAACPMCARNHHGGLPNPNLVEGDWTLEDFKKIMTPEVLNQLEYYYFCGNFGDPMVNNDLISMVEYSNAIAPHVSIRIHTNGGARKTEWWKQLAEVCVENDTVIFALDGLQDTHHLYRVNTTYERVVENAKAFIDAGGNAHWAMIVFKHNEHQVEECRKIAHDYRVLFSYILQLDVHCV
jgi:MoaA/NifB/PqqE/SkfB family radical SAM enzyme